MTAKRWFVSVPSLAVLILAGWLAYVAAQSVWVVMAFQFVLVGVGATILLGAAGGLVFAGLWGWNRWERWRIDIKTAQSKSVQFFGLDGMVYAANADGVPIQALHLDTRSYISPTIDEPDDFNVLKWSAFYSRKQKVIDSLAQPLALQAQLPPGLPPVLPVLVDLQRVLIVGGMGSGKTNLMRWLAAAKQAQSRVLVIDTHAKPGLWPIGCHVIGAQRNYEAVETALDRLVNMMQRRFEEIGRGEKDYREHEIITLCSDEWTMLPEIIGQKEIQRYTKPLLVESRKAGLDFVLAAHDTTVKAIGVEGMGGLREAFDAIVRTRRDQATGQYLCTVQFNKDDIREFTAPPVFVDAPTAEPAWISELKAAPVKEVAPTAPPVGQPEKPTDEENDILVAYFQAKEDNGGKVVWSKVCQAVGLTPGTHQYNRLKTIIRKWTKEDL